MKLGSFDTLVHALETAGVRYLVAGGLAVNAHGYLRFTRDVDVVLQLSPENIQAAFSALAQFRKRRGDRGGYVIQIEFHRYLVRAPR